jgi:hypothetical protein
MRAISISVDTQLCWFPAAILPGIEAVGGCRESPEQIERDIWRARARHPRTRGPEKC